MKTSISFTTTWEIGNKVTLHVDIDLEIEHFKSKFGPRTVVNGVEQD